MSPRDRRRVRYAEWLSAQGLKYDFDREVAALAVRANGRALNDIPPVELWHQIVPTLRVLERVREEFGPTTVLSAYRTPDYNAAVGGETRSQHMENRAVDFQCLHGTPVEWAEFLFGLRDADVFAGGIGTYLTRGFVHIDTRGANATWTR